MKRSKKEPAANKNKLLINDKPKNTTQGTLDRWISKPINSDIKATKIKSTSCSNKESEIVMLSDSESEDDVFCDTKITRTPAKRGVNLAPEERKTQASQNKTKKVIFGSVTTCIQPSRKDRVVLRKSLDLSSLTSEVKSFENDCLYTNFDDTAPKRPKKNNLPMNLKKLIPTGVIYNDKKMNHRTNTNLKLDSERIHIPGLNLSFSKKRKTSISPDSISPRTTNPSEPSLSEFFADDIESSLPASIAEAKEGMNTSSDSKSFVSLDPYSDVCSAEISKERLSVSTKSPDHVSDIFQEDSDTEMENEASVPGFFSLEDCDNNDPLLQQFRNQFSSSKRSKRKVQEEDDVTIVHLDGITSYGKVSKVKASLKQKANTRKARGSSLNPSGTVPSDTLDSSEKPELKALYRRSFVNGKYNKLLYAKLKKEHGYGATKKTTKGKRRKVKKSPKKRS